MLFRSPYHRGKFDERQQMVSERARANSCSIVYVNQVCGQDELVFDGGSMVFDHRGNMLMRAEQFGESLSFIDIEVNESHAANGVPVVEVSKTSRAVGTKHEGTIAPSTSDMEQVFAALVLGTRDYVRKNGFKIGRAHV